MREREREREIERERESKKRKREREKEKEKERKREREPNRKALSNQKLPYRIYEEDVYNANKTFCKLFLTCEV